MSLKKWIKGVNAIGLVSKAGRYSGIYAYSNSIIVDVNSRLATGGLANAFPDGFPPVKYQILCWAHSYTYCYFAKDFPSYFSASFHGFGNIVHLSNP